VAKKKKFRELFKVIFHADLTTNPDYWFTNRRLVVHELLLGCTTCVAVLTVYSDAKWLPVLAVGRKER
jgi:hypothetical protein